MEWWPVNVGKKNLGARRNSRGKEKAKEDAQDTAVCPTVEYGSIAAASLSRQGKRLEWTFAVNEGIERKLHVKGSAAKILPATRPPGLAKAKSSIVQQAEQGAHFLRTYYSDIDITSDLIREELAAHARLSAELDSFDPYSGSLLSLFTCSERTRRKIVYTTFPMGDTNSYLNISPHVFKRSWSPTFRPYETHVWRFSSPIQQILSRSNDGTKVGKGALIAVRTLGATSMFDVQPKASAPQGVVLSELASISRVDVGDKHVTDMVLHHNSTAMFLVSDIGAVFKCNVFSGKKFMQTVFSSSTSDDGDVFWRLAATNEENTLLLLSNQTLQQVDLRSKSALMLCESKQPRHFYTSVEGPIADRLVRLVSNNEIFWIDNRFAKSPVYSMKHGRSLDRTLVGHTVTLGSRPITFLTSKLNSLVTVYDVSQDTNALAHATTLPYALPSLLGSDALPVSSALLHDPFEPEREEVCLLQLSNRGSLHRLDLCLNLENSARGVSGVDAQTHEWSADVHMLDGQMRNTLPDLGPFSGRSSMEVDMEPAYRRLFGMDKASQSNDDPDAVYEVLETMSSFWQNTDAPIDHMLTTYDVILRSGKEPQNVPRADFLTPNSFNSLRGYRALIQNRIPTCQVARRSAWHYNIASSLERLVPSMSTLPERTFEMLKSFDLSLDDSRPAPSFRKETEAREQLTLDLALSEDVYSSHPIRVVESKENVDDAFETMSRAAESLSLGLNEPPPIQFGFLRPSPQYNLEQGRGLEKPVLPMGVRLLLNDWEAGSSPQSYRYYDPYDDSDEPRIAVSRGVGMGPPTQVTTNEARTQSQRAPPVIATAPLVTRAPPTIATSHSIRPPALTQSQDTFTSFHIVPVSGSQVIDTAAQPSQAVLLPSTQILPGPFGGRQAMTKKKPAKKRIGGF